MPTVMNATPMGVPRCCRVRRRGPPWSRSTANSLGSVITSGRRNSWDTAIPMPVMPSDVRSHARNVRSSARWSRATELLFSSTYDMRGMQVFNPAHGHLHYSTHKPHVISIRGGGCHRAPQPA